MSYSSGCGYGSCGANSASYSSNSISYSGLENAVSSYSRSSSDYSGNVSYMASEAAAQTQMYENNNFGFSAYDAYRAKHSGKMITETAAGFADDFLNPSRRVSAFIGNANDIKEFAEEAFFKTTGMPFPDDVVVKILSADNFREGLQGFAINRKDKGLVSEVVVKEDTLDRVMVILGHELGHVMSRRLNNARSEEAKAFAFSLAWIKAIKENNIAGLSTSVCIDRAAKNGIHDKALEFVLNMVGRGKKPMEVFNELISGEVSA